MQSPHRDSTGLEDPSFLGLLQVINLGVMTASVPQLPLRPLCVEGVGGCGVGGYDSTE